jgi:hypothetical protein
VKSQRKPALTAHFSPKPRLRGIVIIAPVAPLEDWLIHTAAALQKSDGVSPHAQPDSCVLHTNSEPPPIYAFCLPKQVNFLPLPTLYRASPKNTSSHISPAKAQIVDVLSRIDRLIDAINSTIGFINTIDELPNDAEDVKNVLMTSKAKLSALRTRVSSQERTEEFYKKWGDSAQKVLDYMRLSVGKMNAKLKVKETEGAVPSSRGGSWTCSPEDTLVMIKQLNEYAAMLGLINNSFLS